MSAPPATEIPGTRPGETLRRSWAYHFLGIGGVGMSALAEWMHRTGYRVTGSDREDSRTLQRLAGLGIDVRAGHEAAHLSGADAIVYTSAIPPDHPMRLAAQRLALPSLHRTEVLAALTAPHRLLAVAGTHGKTTATACLAHVWAACGLDPTALVGGAVLDWEGGNLRLGESHWAIAEADESDGSFLRLRPEAVLLTNAEPDHLDYHGNAEQLERAFAAFLANLPPEGVLVFCADDPGAARLAGGVRCRSLSYGSGAGVEVRVWVEEMRPGRMRATLEHEGQRREFVTSLGGAHNALNLTGVYALGLAHGLPAPDLCRALETFRGVARRQEPLGEGFGFAIFDDYAHHPTEIRATLDMFHRVYGPPVTVVFQPHLYSRTAHFADAFAEALRPAARIYVTEVYAAREEPMEGISGKMIVDRLADHPAATFIEDWRDFPDVVGRAGESGGVLITMGAGDITGLGPLLLRDQRSRT